MLEMSFNAYKSYFSVSDLNEVCMTCFDTFFRLPAVPQETAVLDHKELVGEIMGRARVLQGVQRGRHMWCQPNGKQRCHIIPIEY